MKTKQLARIGSVIGKSEPDKKKEPFAELFNEIEKTLLTILGLV